MASRLSSLLCDFFYIASFKIPHTSTICKKQLLITISSLWATETIIGDFSIIRFFVLPSFAELHKVQCSVIRPVASGCNKNLMRINEKSKTKSNVVSSIKILPNQFHDCQNLEMPQFQISSLQPKYCKRLISHELYTFLMN